ncbi:hypothetical protein EMIHUDRAFT_122165 [Emiliania huxleyi CCMP1516]|uniref:dolichol kinase n=2 Tax=Emiliania huxleyi TaxID=2903 RepID=A0A0D3KSI6_EMIH1|nr:hypothetical protein EMIHUDRAFT_122165 [Emiliania huxleyi CCMP1516]EOD38721.1 hypothetical protein EMIHUDRAFT_122165 [Emiliania huxleyi CCMP1516]|eukprot:XP_005791150.1 hypothetical protein EMIHUDRAFT_122165 [Emiliania huxleyi CCMP1516]
MTTGFVASAVEASLVVLASVLLAVPLHAIGWVAEAAALPLVCLGAAAVGLHLPAPAIVRRLGCCSLRRAPSMGLALGCCSPSLLLCAMALANVRAATPAAPLLRAHLWALLGCAVQPPLVLLLQPLAASLPWWSAPLLSALPPLLTLAVAAPEGADPGITLVSLLTHVAALAWSTAMVRRSFTLGEAAALAQGVAALSADALLMTRCTLAAGGPAATPWGHWGRLCTAREPEAMGIEAVLAGGLALTAAAAAVLAPLRGRASPSARAALLVGGIALALGGVLLPWLEALVVLAPSLLALALAAVVPAFALLELVRVGALPPLARPLAAFLAAFIDSRDAGTLVLTHIYLLAGCALPVWLQSALPPPPPASRAPLAAAAVRGAPLAGVLVLGVGDAMASLVGVRFGRTRWPRSRKTLEGSAAAAGSTLLALLLLLHVSSPDGAPADARTWAALAGGTAVACLLEAATDQIDNLFLPVAYQTWLLIAAVLEPWCRDSSCGEG